MRTIDFSGDIAITTAGTMRSQTVRATSYGPPFVMPVRLIMRIHPREPALEALRRLTISGGGNKYSAQKQGHVKGRQLDKGKAGRDSVAEDLARCYVCLFD